jgi:hypothetical protein
MELENTILSEVSQAEGQKSHVLPHMWIVDPKQCSNFIGHGSHTKRRSCTGAIGKKTKNLNVVDVLTV